MTARILLGAAGTLIVLFGLREVFRDIFHPTKSGSLSDFVGKIASALMRHTFLRPAVGPIALVTVILSWVTALVCGFALIYGSMLPQDLAGMPAGGQTGTGHRVVHSLYLSLGSFDTFQTFDLQPITSWLKLIISIEGLIGISMITASVSWLVLLYPALARMRGWAKDVSILLEAERRSGLSIVDCLGAPVLIELAHAVVQFRLDVVLFPILLNFYPEDRTATISSVLPEVRRIALDARSRTGANDVRLAGVQLEIAMEELARTIRERVVNTSTDDVDTILEAFRRRSD